MSEEIFYLVLDYKGSTGTNANRKSELSSHTWEKKSMFDYPVNIG